MAKNGTNLGPVDLSSDVPYPPQRSCHFPRFDSLQNIEIALLTVPLVAICEPSSFSVIYKGSAENNGNV